MQNSNDGNSPARYMYMLHERPKFRPVNPHFYITITHKKLESVNTLSKVGVGDSVLRVKYVLNMYLSPLVFAIDLNVT